MWKGCINLTFRSPLLWSDLGCMLEFEIMTCILCKWWENFRDNLPKSKDKLWVKPSRINSQNSCSTNIQPKLWTILKTRKSLKEGTFKTFGLIVTHVFICERRKDTCLTLFMSWFAGSKELELRDEFRSDRQPSLHADVCLKRLVKSKLSLREF